MDSDPSASLVSQRYLCTAPSSTQSRTFHPSFDREVYSVVFMIEDTEKCFRVDAMRLTMHSKFLRELLFDKEGLIGSKDEGTEAHPIIVKGISEEAFAHFLGWLNHDSWSPLVACHLQQLLDIMHISHLYEIRPGVEFVSKELGRFGIRPARLLHLAHKYSLLDWVNGPVRMLLEEPLKSLTAEDKEDLGFELYSAIAVAKESIALERHRLANHPPFPKSFDDGPFCVPAQHINCKRIWTEKWFFVIVRQIHNPKDPLPLSMIPDALDAIEHKGMSLGCKDFILTWLRGSCEQVQKEEELIASTVADICSMFI